MNTDFTWLQSLVPDVLKTARQRYLILEQIAMQAPVGRRVVAKSLAYPNAMLELKLII